MRAVNCWEYMKCGSERTCPAASFEAADGFLGGKNGGRACTYVTGTFCSGTVQGTHQEKEKHCSECPFYKLLRQEHGADCTVLSFSTFMRKANL